MKNIDIRVACCNFCGGYRSSMLEDKKFMEHPEVVDHFFYHGEPWFTFDEETFRTVEKQNGVFVKTVKLLQHREQDKDYCNCSVKKHQNPKIELPVFSQTLSSANAYSAAKDSELYFRDIYSLSFHFH